MCICRVCLKKDQTVVTLDRNDVEDSQIFHMLDDLVHPAWYSTRAKLPDEICKACIDGLERAFEFKQRYKESIYEFAQDQKGNKADASSERKSQNSQYNNSITASNVNIEEINGNVYRNRKYQCKICHRRHYLKGEWKTHQERHATKEKQFKCRKCGLTFLAKKHFAVHLCRRKKEELNDVKYK